MIRIVLLSAAAGLAALVPAGIGLASNPSMSQSVPVAPAQVRSTLGPDLSPSSVRTRHAEPGDDRGGRSAEPGDDRGGVTRHAEPGDDHGGATTHAEPGDDHGGRHGGGN